jgi:hypothetical protein
MSIIEFGVDKMFLDIDNTFDYKKMVPRMKFNEANFVAMEEEMKKGNDIVIPVYDRTVYGRLPEGNSGIGSVILAQRRHSPIVPVAVDIHTDEPFGQAEHMIKPKTVLRSIKRDIPEATVRIGAPIYLEGISEDDMAEALKLFSNRDSFGRTSVDERGRRVVTRDVEDKARYEKAKETFRKLKAQGAQIMNAVADLLPHEKRGKWGTIPSVSPPGEAVEERRNDR